MSSPTDEITVIGILTADSQYIQVQNHLVYQRLLKKYQEKELEVTVKVLRYKRSDSQNRYMWGVIVKYVQAWLYETQGEKLHRDAVYTWLRTKLLNEQPKIVNIAGEDVITMTGKRFGAMNTKEFAEAVDTIRAEMLKRGCDIPEPGGKNRHNFLHEFIDE